MAAVADIVGVLFLADGTECTVVTGSPWLQAWLR
jgi:hypothetical protein